MGVWDTVKKGVAIGAPIVGTYFGGPIGGAIGGAIGAGIAGGQPKAGGGQSSGGWNNMPPQLQQAYMQQFLPGAQQWFNSGPNQYQQNAMQSLGGGPEALQRELPQYQNQYRGAVTDEVVKQMQRDAQGERDRIMMGAGSNGLGGLFGSALTKQLDGLNDNTLNRIGAYRAYSEDQGYNQSLDLRRQTLADMLTAGNMPAQRLEQFGSMLGRFPQGNTSTNWGASQNSNWADKLGSGAVTLGGLAAQSVNPQGGGWGSIMPFDMANNMTGGRPWSWDR